MTTATAITPVVEGLGLIRPLWSRLNRKLPEISAYKGASIQYTVQYSVHLSKGLRREETALRGGGLNYKSFVIYLRHIENFCRLLDALYTEYTVFVVTPQIVFKTLGMKKRRVTGGSIDKKYFSMVRRSHKRILRGRNKIRFALLVRFALKQKSTHFFGSFLVLLNVFCFSFEQKENCVYFCYLLFHTRCFRIIAVAMHRFRMYKVSSNTNSKSKIYQLIFCIGIA